MLRLYGIMLVLNGQLLCSLQCFQRFLGKLVIVHIHSTSIQIEISNKAADRSSLRYRSQNGSAESRYGVEPKTRLFIFAPPCAICFVVSTLVLRLLKVYSKPFPLSIG